MNQCLGVIMPTENVNRNPSSATPSQTVAARSTDFATAMPVTNKKIREGKPASTHWNTEKTESRESQENQNNITKQRKARHQNSSIQMKLVIKRS
jgi:hypothetical protein